MLRAAHFEFWGVQGISDTPRIISPLGNPMTQYSTWLFPVVVSLTFHISLSFSHIPFIIFICLRRGLGGRHSVLYLYSISFLSCCFFKLLGKLGDAGSSPLWFYFWGVQGISNTPKIVSARPSWIARFKADSDMTGREHARNIMLNFFAVPGSQCIDPKKQPETTCIKDNKTLCKINIVQGLLMMYFFFNTVLVGYAMLRISFCR